MYRIRALVEQHDGNISHRAIGILKTRGDRFEIPSEGINYETFERDLILQAMEKSDWVIAKASKMLGMSYRTLQYRLDKFNLKKPDGRGSATL